jgi:hypothetical protein
MALLKPGILTERERALVIDGFMTGTRAVAESLKLFAEDPKAAVPVLFRDFTMMLVESALEATQAVADELLAEGIAVTTREGSEASHGDA